MHTTLPMFIAMDPPKHDEQRKTVSPIVAPANLATDGGADPRAHGPLLDSLPRRDLRLGRQGVDRADHADAGDAVRLSVRGPPQADLLVRRGPRCNRPTAMVADREERAAELLECAAYFTRLWNERVNAPPRNDLVSMLAHGEATRNMTPQEYSAT
jgi:cytochrome P450